MEPPPRLEFSNSSGAWLDCSASGSPQPSIDWLSVDGTSVGDVGGVRRVLRNGTLVLLPFPAAAYRQDIHNTIYRCVASNNIGRVISRDVQVRAGEYFFHFTILLSLLFFIIAIISTIIRNKTIVSTSFFSMVKWLFETPSIVLAKELPLREKYY